MKPPDKPSPNYKHGDVVTVVDQVEIHRLRDIAIKWYTLSKIVHAELGRANAWGADSEMYPPNVAIAIFRIKKDTEESLMHHTAVPYDIFDALLPTKEAINGNNDKKW